MGGERDTQRRDRKEIDSRRARQRERERESGNINTNGGDNSTRLSHIRAAAVTSLTPAEAAASTDTLYPPHYFPSSKIERERERGGGREPLSPPPDLLSPAAAAEVVRAGIGTAAAGFQDEEEKEEEMEANKSKARIRPPHTCLHS